MGKLGTYIPPGLHQTGAVICDYVGVVGVSHGVPGALFGIAVGGLLHYFGLPHNWREKISDYISSTHRKLAHSESSGENFRGAYKGSKILRNILVLFDGTIAGVAGMEAMEGNIPGAVSNVLFTTGVTVSTVACQVETSSAAKKLEELLKSKT